MYSNLFSSLLTNLSLLVLIATILTKIPFVKNVFAKENSSKISDKLLLAGIFGLFCIFSTCSGVKVSGAIQNTRVLGALVAGLLGGPVVGMGAAIIGSIHRFFYDPQGFTSLACTISTLFEGILGSLVWYIYKKKNIKQSALSLFLITTFAESCQMLIILAIAKPFSAALDLVKIIALPMILINSFGMVLFFSIFEEVFTKQYLLAGSKIKLALNIADQCIPYIQKTSKSIEDYTKIADIIKQYSHCMGVLMVSGDGKTILNRSKLTIPESLLHPGTYYELDQCYYKSGKNDPNGKILGKYTAISANLTVGYETWSHLVLFLPGYIRSIQVEKEFLNGLAKFFSTNYELSRIEQQKKLLQRAEFKALQSQINPHFLFNSLNTISFFCREKPERAKELLLALSVYFRNTLNSSNSYMISITQELEHVRAYLMLEKARFEDRLTVTIEFEDENDFTVPTLILQPIVENAVKHGAMKRQLGHVTIKGEKINQLLEISVIDNGPGIPKNELESFQRKSTCQKCGLRNVDTRLRSIYGEKFGLIIKTSESGTIVIMRIPNKILEG